MNKPPTDQGTAQRAIVLQVLRDDHDARWTRAELRAEIYDIEPRTIGRALKRLGAEGVVILEGNEVRASSCAQHLDALGMVSI